MMTLEELMSKTTDGELLDIYLEIYNRVVPNDGYAQKFRRKVNKLIDSGDLCLYRNGHRNLYMPTFTKAVEQEMARRYMSLIILGRID